MKEKNTLYYISHHHSFMHHVISGIIMRFPKEVIPYIKLIFPNKRLCHSFYTSFLEMKLHHEFLLPQIMSFTDIEENHHKLYDTKSDHYLPISTPPLLSKTQQIIALIPLILQWKPQISYKMAMQLASELIHLLEETEKEQSNLTIIEQVLSEISTLFAAHMEETVEFLKIMYRYWYVFLQEQGYTTALRRRDTIFNAISSFLIENPPTYPIILAGSTGSQRVTSQFIKTLHSLSNGYVILPGWDGFLPEEEWHFIEAQQPLYCLKELIFQNAIKINEVEEWYKEEPQEKNPFLIQRFSFLSQAISTSQSITISKECNFDSTILENINYITCRNVNHEALTIFYAILDQLQKKSSKIALLTYDRQLVHQIKLYLQPYPIKIDDAAGLLLEHHPLWINFMLLLETVQHHYKIHYFLPYLLHSYTSLFQEDLVEPLKKLLFTTKNPSLISLKEAIEHFTFIDKNVEIELVKARDKIEQESHLLTLLFSKSSISLQEMLHAHFTLWKKWVNAKMLDSEESSYIVNFIEELLLASEAFPAINPYHYSLIIKAFIKHTLYPEPAPEDPSHVVILSPMDARYLHFDSIIMAGMNEDSWPKIPKTGPWLNKIMRKEMGFAPLEKSIGQSAQDFLGSFKASTLIMTRSLKNTQGDMAEESRFIKKLLHFCEAVGFSSPFNPDFPYNKWADLHFNTSINLGANSLFTPPIALKTLHYSVSSIALLMTDPIAFYYAYVLHIKPLPYYEKSSSKAYRGIWLHRVFTDFINNTKEDFTESTFIEIANRLLPFEDPAIILFWKPKISFLAPWFCANYREKQKSQTQFYAEKYMSATFDSPRGPISISGRADRVEVDVDGNMTIIDYKTGKIPSKEEILKAITPQLWILACIFRKKKEEMKARTLIDLQYYAILEQAPYVEIISFAQILKSAGYNFEEYLAQFEASCLTLLEYYSYDENSFQI